MKLKTRKLLCIAVAEEIYGYIYTSKEQPYILENYLLPTKAMKLLFHVLETSRAEFQRATIETPVQHRGGVWWVKFTHKDGSVHLKASGHTMEEAIVRASLLSRGVVVDA